MLEVKPSAEKSILGDLDSYPDSSSFLLYEFMGSNLAASTSYYKVTLITYVIV